MVIAKDAYKIPDKIMKRIITGEYCRYGSVVRNASGQIVTHLKPVAEREMNAKTSAMIAKAVQIVGQHKVLTVAIAVSAMVIVGGTAAHVIAKKRMPKEIKEFRIALAKYLQATKDGCVTTELLDELAACMEKVKSAGVDEGVQIVLTGEELETLFRLMSESAESREEKQTVLVDLERFLNYRKNAASVA